MITLDLIEYVDYKWEVMAPASEARNDSLKHGSSTTLPDMVKLVLLGVVGGGGGKNKKEKSCYNRTI